MNSKVEMDGCFWEDLKSNFSKSKFDLWHTEKQN